MIIVNNERPYTVDRVIQTKQGTTLLYVVVMKFGKSAEGKAQFNKYSLFLEEQNHEIREKDKIKITKITSVDYEPYFYMGRQNWNFNINCEIEIVESSKKQLEKELQEADTPLPF